MCGEQARHNERATGRNGSSPRVRGTDVKADRRSQGGRFIPACAGNRSPAANTTSRKPVHPRVCGEQGSLKRISASTIGSSPRVRGTGCRFGKCGSLGRFIPACAGNSWRQEPQLTPQAVHPRVCGEQWSANPWVAAVTGSSPRVRGTDFDFSRLRCVNRFIPACAGNSPVVSERTLSRTVHPRVCGEQPLGTGAGAGCSGSSPRVRGTGAAALANAQRGRFIPACAGNRRIPAPGQSG
ncbi:conserved hypothetical protein [Rhodospirillum rubrum ATCC 11170]|nr:conserved hypothetical protein [Rhodospirillum rubrum ATCC 11170]